ncbi:hypothetical protein PRUB_a3838 [Pseudoalteromonas rubra]|uniref:Uncharacterized protein n=1 Tax=Pseudoalteromonas rubra TaxID=43658 RepID=A0A8T0C9E2_9GAMM|nr:hypothetical protein PRUB_a3838 [Pseudoalteromonas rubra]
MITRFGWLIQKNNDQSMQPAALRGDAFYLNHISHPEGVILDGYFVL